MTVLLNIEKPSKVLIKDLEELEKTYLDYLNDTKLFPKSLIDKCVDRSLTVPEYLKNQIDNEKVHISKVYGRDSENWLPYDVALGLIEIAFIAGVNKVTQ